MMGTLPDGLGTVNEGDEDVLDSPDEVAVNIIDKILRGEEVGPVWTVKRSTVSMEHCVNGALDECDKDKAVSVPVSTIMSYVLIWPPFHHLSPPFSPISRSTPRRPSLPGGWWPRGAQDVGRRNSSSKIPGCGSRGMDTLAWIPGCGSRGVADPPPWVADEINSLCSKWYCSSSRDHIWLRTYYLRTYRLRTPLSPP